jgi:lipoate-protein ligase A
MHHGTILVDLDKDAAVRCLNVNKEKLKSKGVDSVRQRIVNLTEVSPRVNFDTLSTALIEEFLRAYGAGAGAGDRLVEELDEAKLKSIPELNKLAEEYADWEWRFGASPEFEHNLETRFDWGIMDVYLSSEKGRIRDVRIYSDSLYPRMIEELQKALLGTTYDMAGVALACDQAKTALARSGVVGCDSCLDDVKAWLIQKL